MTFAASSRPLAVAFSAALIVGAIGCGDDSGSTKFDFRDRPATSQQKQTQVRRLLVRANEAMGKNQPGEAMLYLDDARTIAPDDREVLAFFAAVSYDRALASEKQDATATRGFLRKTLDAVARLEAQPEGLPAQLTGIKGEALATEGRVLAAEGKLDEALALLTQADQAGFASPESLEGLNAVQGLADRPEYKALVTRVSDRAMSDARERAKATMAETQPFPFDFQLPDLDGKTRTLADMKGAKATIVDIWGTWCPPCRREIPHFAELHARYGDKGLAVVGLNYENETDQDAAATLIRKFAEQYKIPYPCLIGDDATREQVPNFSGFPTTLFLDDTGRVRATLVGYHPMRDLEAIVTTLLEEKPAG
jgi:thiol-disulfide isomerase/thioredoxin